MNLDELHQHSTCSHELKYCNHCDIVYCNKCSTQWYKNTNYTWWYPATSTVFTGNVSHENHVEVN